MTRRARLTWLVLSMSACIGCITHTPRQLGMVIASDIQHGYPRQDAGATSPGIDRTLLDATGACSSTDVASALLAMCAEFGRCLVRNMRRDELNLLRPYLGRRTRVPRKTAPQCMDRLLMSCSRCMHRPSNATADAVAQKLAASTECLCNRAPVSLQSPRPDSHRAASPSHHSHAWQVSAASPPRADVPVRT